MIPFNPAIFREYDIRGVAGRDFDEAFAAALGRAFASHLQSRVTPGGGRQRLRVAVGRDCRLTSEPYAAALRRGLLASGIDVVDIGVVPTPLLYFSLFQLDVDGGVQVTGSHNPADQNGFKLCVGQVAIHGEEIQEVRRRLEAGQAPEGAGREEREDVVSRYREFLAARFGRLPRPLRVVIDAGNATAGPIAPAVFRDMGCEVDELYCEMDGRFPNHHPDPTVAANLRDLIERVRSTGAVLGIGFDGDADRIGAVSANGRILWGDELLILFAREVLEHHPGATVVAEVKCTQRLFDDVAARGGRAIMWKAGHSPIKAKMRETGALLGGEMSGHMFFADEYFGYDDAIYAACRLLRIVSRAGRPPHELLADLAPAYSTPEIRVECPDGVKFRVVERVRDLLAREHDVVDVDGVRVRFPKGWGLLRASNTQPALVMRFEAESEELLERYRKQMEELVTEVRRELGAGA